MNKRQFVDSRREAWHRLESLVQRVESRSKSKRLRGRELNEYSRLFREVASDLALIRSKNWGDRLTKYLNNLLARAHGGFYSAPPQNLSGFTRFLSHEFPVLFRRYIGYFYVAAALFFIPFIAGWITVQTNPELASRVVSAEQLRDAAAMYDFDPDEPGRSVFSAGRTQMSGFYVYNNAGIALRSFAGGVFFGTMTIYVLLANGIQIGVIAGYIVSQGHWKSFTSFIISHGSFELTALAIAGGAGLMLGDALLHPGNRTRLESLMTQGLDAVKIAIGAAVMLVIAAMIEAFWSPSGVPSTVKYIVGSALWLLVIAYLAFAGQERAG